MSQDPIPLERPLIQGTAPDGQHFTLAVTRADDTCYVLRNGDRIFSAPADAPGIDAAVDILLHNLEPHAR